ncbi:homoserine O-acetyltransferase [Clostridium sp. DJ247]|uniref:homoserine O-acetyltransferase MetX n=1 Tax=Clostridium sp. DJ247 TaxID=2726188 RepID=UPI001629A272|nr:homoserine O-acetyltransferase [Clostridium sp. DJ247]MBC2579540.1 homoserine O-acetyltransferase [Clostridium sp. DJ247]
MNKFLYRKENYKEYLTFALDEDFLLESKKTFGPITLCYESYGTLNAEKNNCILITHALTGNSHIAKHDENDVEGWWEDFVGAGKVFDTNKYFIICSNILGGCNGSTGPSSINPKTGKHYGIEFPIITIKDMVNAQKKIFEYLDINHLVAAVGGSMGGMQSLQWAASYPDFMDGIINLAAPLSLSSEAVGIDHIMRKSIMCDPNWNNGDYYSSKLPSNGLSIARMVAMLTYQTRDLMNLKFGRKLKSNVEDFYNDFNAEFQIDSYLSYQGLKLVDRFDANSYLYLTRALDLFDLKREYGTYESALSRIKAKFLLAAVSSDALFQLNELRKTRDALRISGVDLEYHEVQSDYGHDSFLIEVEKYKYFLAEFLDNLYVETNLDNTSNNFINLTSRQEVF